MNLLVLLLLMITLSAASSRAAPHHYPAYHLFVSQPYLSYRLDVPHLPPPSVTRFATTPAPDTIPLSLPEIGLQDPIEVAQFHSQDAAGRVVFGFNSPGQTRMEARALDGSVRGSYSYRDPTGKLVRMHYWDDGRGFHTVGNNLPASYNMPPQYTPEVQAAREQHFQLYRQALALALASGAATGGDNEDQSSDDSSVNTDTDVPSEALVNQVQPAESPAETDKVENQETANEEDGQVDQVKNDSKTDEADFDAVAIESADFASFKSKPLHRRVEPEANRKQVAQLAPLASDVMSPGQLAISRTGADGYQYLVPVVAPLPGTHTSESLTAAIYGAIPVSAVHDAQVSPAQRNNLEDHQVKPLLFRTSLGVRSA